MWKLHGEAILLIIVLVVRFVSTARGVVSSAFFRHCTSCGFSICYRVLIDDRKGSVVFYRILFVSRLYWKGGFYCKAIFVKRWTFGLCVVRQSLYFGGFRSQLLDYYCVGGGFQVLYILYFHEPWRKVKLVSKHLRRLIQSCILSDIHWRG